MVKQSMNCQHLTVQTATTGDAHDLEIELAASTLGSECTATDMAAPGTSSDIGV